MGGAEGGGAGRWEGQSRDGDVAGVEQAQEIEGWGRHRRWRGGAGGWEGQGKSRDGDVAEGAGGGAVCRRGQSRDG